MGRASISSVGAWLSEPGRAAAVGARGERLGRGGRVELAMARVPGRVRSGAAPRRAAALDAIARCASGAGPRRVRWRPLRNLILERIAGF